MRRNSLVAVAVALLALAFLAVSTRGALGHADHPGATVPITKAPGLRLELVGTFTAPTYVTSAPGDPSRLFVVEKRGTIRVVENGVVQPQPFLDIHDLVHSTEVGEAGLLSIAFARDYEKSGLLYITYNQNDWDLRLEEVRRSPSDPGRALRSTRRRVLEVEHSSTAVHNGGQLHFGPDGYLYWSVGDGDPTRGARGNGQKLGRLLGKILRIDPRRQPSGRPYRVPRGNPFVGRSGADEIWSYGLRNPWRFSFDRATGALWIGDVGQEAWEEVDFSGPRRRGRGANFGWSCFEGSHRYPRYPAWACPPAAHVRPALEYPHRAGGACAVTGGYVVRDSELPLLAGRYVYGDYCTGALHAVKRQDGRIVEDRSVGLVVPRLTTFGEDRAGHLYVASFGGRVWRLRADP